MMNCSQALRQGYLVTYHCVKMIDSSAYMNIKLRCD